LALKLGSGYLSEVRNLKVEGEGLTGERTAYAGKITATVNCGFPCVATVVKGFYDPATGSRGQVETLRVEGIQGPKTHLLEVLQRQKGTVDLKNASIIISVGRGVKKKEDLVMIEELASALGGAVGCSRPLSSDLGWLPEERHIGLTGVAVRPSLYLALGISGQLQHVAGIKDSKIIAAVNTDKDAPIFQVADYGIVGDLYSVVPTLIKLLKA
jgi:electron transfer flavoprotein alpha subunit